MYKDGWWLSMRMPRIPWRLDPEMLKTFAPGVWNPDDDPVERVELPFRLRLLANIADKYRAGVSRNTGSGATTPV